MLRDCVVHPCVRALVCGGQLVQREGLSDPPPELVRHDLELCEQTLTGYRIACRGLEAAVALLPLTPHGLGHCRHGRRNYPLLRATNTGPRCIELREHSLAQLVARPRQSKSDVGVQTLETARTGSGSADTELELGPNGALLRMGALEARGQLGVFRSRPRPALDAAGGLDTRHRGDEVRTRQPVRGRKGLAGIVVRALLGNCWTSERATNDDTPKGAWRPS